MRGKLFITRQGYDPERGKHVKDPYLGDLPSLGACRTDIRKQLEKGDHVYVLSGKVQGVLQFVMGGFEIDNKIDATEAYKRFPEQRLRKLPDGQLAGNVIVAADGTQHPLDGHRSSTFDKRIKNYVIGKNGLALVTPAQIAAGRSQTMDALRDILQKDGKTPIELVGRWGANLTETQVFQLREWLKSLQAVELAANGGPFLAAGAAN